MAVTAREILLVFRGQNYLSNAIRRVGADVGGLSRATQLSNQRAQLNINKSSLLTTQSRLQSERQSIINGSRRLAQDKAIAMQNVTQLRAVQQRLLAESRMSQLNRAVSAGKPMPGLTMEETVMQQKAAMMAFASTTQQVMMQELNVQKLSAAETQLAERLGVVDQSLGVTGERLDLVRNKIGQVSIAERQLKFQNFADGAAKVEHFGRVVQMAGLIGSAAMGYMADQAAKFNTSMVLAATQSTTAVNNSTKNIVRNSQVLQNAVQRMLTQGKTAAQPSDLSNALYQIFSGLTFKGSQASQLRQGLSILQSFNKVFTANYGQVQFNDVVTAGINLMNNFGISASRLPAILNRMQASVRFGAMDMGHFVSSLSQVVPSFRAAHYSFTQLAQDVAFVSRLFPQSLRTGTTGLARLTEMFARPNVIQGIKSQFGLNIAPGGQLLPLNQIISSLEKARPGIFATSQAIGSFFKTVGGTQGTIQARRVLAGYVQEMGLYHTVARQVGGDNQELNRSFKAMQQTPGVKLQEFFNQLRGIALTLGAGAIPAFKAFIGPIVAAIKWFDQLNPRTQKAIGYFASLISIGALLGGTLASVGGGLARMGAILAATVSGKRGLAGLAEEGGFATTRLMLMLGVIGVLIVAFTQFHGQTMAIINALGGIKDVIGMALGAIVAINILKAVRAASAFAKTLYGVRDAEIAVEAANPFILIAAAIGLLVVYAIEHWHTLTRGWEIMVNGLYKFFVNYFINPIIKAINYMSDAWNATLGHIFGGIGKLNELSSKGPFNIIYPGSDSGAAAASAMQKMWKQAQAHGAVAGTYGMGLSTRANPGGYLTRKGLIEAGYDPYSYGRGASTRDDPAGFLKLGSAADRAFRKTKAYLDQIHRGMQQHKKDLHDATAAARTYGTTATESFNKAYQAYVEALKVAQQNPKNLQDQMKMEQALMNLQNVANKQQLAAAKRAADAQVKANNTVAQSAKITFQNVLDGIQGMYQNFLQNEQTIFGQLFQGPFMNSPQMQNYTAWGGIPTGAMLAKDLRSQLTQFRRFHAELNELNKRGAPQQLIQQLTQLGPSAMPQIEALLKLGRGALNNYFRMFREGQRMQQQQAMKDLREQLNQYRKFGNKVAEAIVAGIQDQNRNVTEVLKKMIRQMFPGLGGGAQYGRGVSHTTTHIGRTHAAHHAAHAATHTGRLRRYYRRRAPSPPLHTTAYRPPSRGNPQFVDYVKTMQYPLQQRGTSDAVANAIQRQRHIFHTNFYRQIKAAEPIKVHVTGWNKNNTGGDYHHHDHYHVDAGKGATVDTQIRHAAFRSRSKHTRRRIHGDRYNL